jgi:hypothetical protein
MMQDQHPTHFSALCLTTPLAPSFVIAPAMQTATQSGSSQ